MSARIFFAFLLAAASVIAEPRWIKIASPNFEMYSTAGEKTARETLQYFEQVRSFFEQASGKPVDNRIPVRIVAFNSPKEFDPYRFNQAASAYYKGTEACDYIVLSHAGWDTFPMATHEYVHLVVKHSNLNFPLWLNEGIAEVYATLRPYGKEIIVGTLIPGRREGLFRDKWIPLPALLSIDQNSPYYNEKDQAGAFYNESWALTHMLMLGDGYRDKFRDVMAAISAGKSSQEVIESTYGKSLNVIEQELLGYMRGSRFQGAVFPVKMQSAADLRAEPAPPFDLKLTLIDVRNRPSIEAETKKALEELSKEDPMRPEPYVMLGYLAWQTNQQDEAVAQMAKAFELGSRNPKMLWDYGRLAENHAGQDSLRALGELLLQLDPARIDVRVELAAVEMTAHQSKEALETLRPVHNVTPELAPRFFYIMAYAQLQTGDRDGAAKNTEQLAKFAKTAQERDQAESLRTYLEQSARVVATIPEARPADPEIPPQEARPHIQYKPQPMASFSGKFVSLVCAGVQAKILLDTPDGKKVLLIDDPNKVLINYHDGEKMDLGCGPQTPARQVRIEYDPPAAGSKGIDGVVRTINLDR